MEGEGQGYQLVALLTPSGVIMALEPPCNVDPCEYHDSCHCECPCMPDYDDNCAECAEAFEED